MTRIRMTLLVAVLLAAIGLAACGDDDDGGGSGQTGTGDDSPQALADGTLTVCSDIPYAPFEFTEGSEVKGIDADLMRAIGEELGVDVEFRDTDFDGIFAALAANQCDVIASAVSITDERKENNLFSDGYFEINQSLLVRSEDAATIDDLSDLDGKVVGVQSETTGAAFAEERAADNGYTVKEFTGADELFTALKADQVDAVLQDFPVNAFEAAKTGESEVVQVFTETEKESYGFVIPLGEEDLQDAINEALDAIREDGTYDEVIEEYLGDQATA